MFKGKAIQILICRDNYMGFGSTAAIIIIACVIFSRFASTPPVVDSDAAPAAMVWKYIGELVFNMLVLVGTVKMRLQDLEYNLSKCR